MEGASSQEEVKVGILLVALRSRGEEHGLGVARLVAANLGAGMVVGMDVAGDEGSYPLAGQGPMVAGVQEASRLGVPLTLHAGEWPEKYGSLANLEWAVGEAGVVRIGHGIAVRSAEANLLKEMKKIELPDADNSRLEQVLSSLQDMKAAGLEELVKMIKDGGCTPPRRAPQGLHRATGIPRNS